MITYNAHCPVRGCNAGQPKLFFYHRKNSLGSRDVQIQHVLLLDSVD